MCTTVHKGGTPADIEPYTQGRCPWHLYTALYTREVYPAYIYSTIHKGYIPGKHSLLYSGEVVMASVSGWQVRYKVYLW